MNEQINNKIALAESSETSPELLRELSEDKNEFVRATVAKNPSTPKDTLVLLSKDKRWYVLREVANNPNTPQKILCILAEDEDIRVSYASKINLNNRRK